jgi:hypothetical protein
MSYPVYEVPAGDVLPVFFASYGKTNGESITLTGLAVTDIEIYKDGSVTQRASDAGYTLLDTDGIDFDGITGIHGFSIDTGDNTDAGFYTVGAWFHVVVSAVTIDSQTVSFVACAFRLKPAETVAGTPKVDAAAISGDATAADNLETAYDDTAGAVPWAGIIDQGTAQSAGANQIVLRAGAAFVDDALIGCTVVITDGTQVGSRSIITDYVGATDTATLGNGWTGATPTGTPAYKIFGSAAGASTVDANVTQWNGSAVATPTVAGVPEVDVTHVAGSTTDVSTIPASVAAILVDTGTTLQAEVDGIQADTEDIQSRLPAALVSGRMDASVGAMAADVITAAATAADFGTEIGAAVLTAAAANPIDANIQEINDAALTGNGTAGTPWDAA